ncbi:MAG: biopolymer transporter ExbD [Gammaproteobacteria bacterium]|nr:biopolymer transporter ExbD [Gammaproteobacteria bacterium]
MRSHKRRLKRDPVALDITAFMNLIVVLVPFLLTSVVFSRLAVLELNLPTAASGPTEMPRDLQLEITIRPDALEVGDRNTGLLQRFAATKDGHDYPALSAFLQQLKARYPDKIEATILSEQETSYDTLVQVLDAVRMVPADAAKSTAAHELFPDISIGDAPRAPQARAGAGRAS